MRHRKSCFSSRALGALKDVTVQPLRIEGGEHVADGPVLARSIDALKHDQHGMTRVGVHLVLQLPEPPAILVQRLLGGFLVPAEGAVRILIAQPWP